MSDQAISFLIMLATGQVMIDDDLIEFAKRRMFKHDFIMCHVEQVLAELRSLGDMQTWEMVSAILILTELK